ncbi:MAG: hypothetical protein KC448_15095 [Yoonia sp.]|nr:hypothetical protein [Yoonia sp.]
MQSKQDKYVEEFQALWNELGGAEAVINISEDDLIVRAARLGASERQIYNFLGMRQTFVDVEESVQRQNRDPEYAAEVKRGAAEFDSLVQSATEEKIKNGGWFRGFLSRLFG